MIKSLWVELFTFVFLLLSLVSYSQTDDIHFDCISLDDGLSHNKVM